MISRDTNLIDFKFCDYGTWGLLLVPCVSDTIISYHLEYWIAHSVLQTQILALYFLFLSLLILAFSVHWSNMLFVFYCLFQVKYHLRFGAGTERTSDLLSSLEDTGWHTHLLFPEVPDMGPRNPLNNDGGDPGELSPRILTLIFCKIM